MFKYISCSFAAEPWHQWAKWCHIPHVERREKRFLPNCGEGITATFVLSVQTCHTYVRWEELRRQIQTGWDFPASRV